jgi:hypothetical protein
VGDLTALIKLVMLIEQIPSVDGCVDTDAKILTEASIFHHVGTQLLSTLVLDFLAKAVEVLNCGEVMALFGLWLSWKCRRRVVSLDPPPNDMSSANMQTCRENVRNVGLTCHQIMSSGPCQTT